MIEAAFDTNILIDALKGVQMAQAELQRVGRRWISRITWIEVMVGARPEEAKNIEDFLDFFSIIELNEEIGRRAAAMRRERPGLKLPDAIIWASAQVSGRILVTRNSKDFPAIVPGIRIPYKI